MRAQLGPHRLREEGGGEGAGEADEEEDEIGQPQVGGAQRYGVGTWWQTFMKYFPTTQIFSDLRY